MRFIVNLPAVEYQSFERLFFAIESAHWFYDDFYREKYPHLPRLPLKHFAGKLFDHTSLLQHYRPDVERLTAQFQSYKQEVPTCGAALLNPTMDKVVLVRGWGQTARWGFPKGKLSKDETELEAATREVLEETGFDMTPYVNDSTFFIDSLSSGRYCRIFLVTNILEGTKFVTQTRKEISDIQWVPISALPDSPKSAKLLNKSMSEKDAKASPNREKKKLFSQNGLAPFTKRLRSWIRRQSMANDSNYIRQASIPVPAQSHPSKSSVYTVPLENFPEAMTQEEEKVLSVREVEANLVPARQDTSGKRRGGRTKPKSYSDSNGKGSGRKSRKEALQVEASRNKATFGSEGASMNDVERDKLFRQYVLETDQIAAAKGLMDDCWPVPYVTSKDFTEEEVRDAEAARKASLAKHAKLNAGLTCAVSAADGNGVVERIKVPQKKFDVGQLARHVEQPFSFDRQAIRACMTRGSLS